jgi:hypothetical protein
MRSFSATSFALGFAFVVLALSFAIFSFASTGGVFGGHVAILIQEEVGERSECARAEHVSCSPSS